LNVLEMEAEVVVVGVAIHRRRQSDLART
jgi:hypothetical protein